MLHTPVPRYWCRQGLVDVDLSGNLICVEGAKVLAGGIGASTSLAAVALDNNDLREEGGQAFLQAVSACTCTMWSGRGGAGSTQVG